MVRFSVLASVLAAWVATVVAAPTDDVSIAARGDSDAARYILYFDKWHTAKLPEKTMTAGITHVIMAFAEPGVFITDPVGKYEPHMNLADVRRMFDQDVKISMCIGSWGFTDGFREGVSSPETRALYAKNIAETVNRLGYDGVDIDWEYPGEDSSWDDSTEVEGFPLLLAEIKKAIGDKELSVAVPALERDMHPYTAENVRSINDVVDYVNVMTYDLLDARDAVSGHHTSVKDSLAAIDTYIERGFPASKLNLGFGFYAKYFTLKNAKSCNEAIGCPLVPAKNENSGAMTFEDQNLPARRSYPKSVADSFKEAFENGIEDVENGGQWYVDLDTSLFWTWDTPALIERKFDEIVAPKRLGGVMAWSMAEDSHDWRLLAAMQKGVENLGLASSA
ncbi:Endochitinase B [Ceratocystis fimbriata CBS 114723]|uniref:chitinase n=1 Tax=Ceratocystis fimbriata CBS 114723 TaxID=1035309 RepID=A0A2C5XBW3_9PEZI|nr:Endochitinase B [Ceratocystis fimbriata CBS 114723]